MATGRTSQDTKRHPKEYATSQPVDTVWGLAVICTLSTFLSSIVTTNAAFFYSRFGEEYGVSHESASWPFTIAAMMNHLVGWPVYLLQRHISTYSITLFGSILTWFGLMSSVFSTNLGWITFSVGFLHGSGKAILLVCMSVYTMNYFDKYRGTVSGLKSVGWSAPGLLFPVVLAALTDAFGVSTSLLLLGSFMMNITPMVFLMKCPEKTLVISCFCPVQNTSLENPNTKTPLNEQNRSSVRENYDTCSGKLEKKGYSAGAGTRNTSFSLYDMAKRLPARFTRSELFRFKSKNGGVETDMCGPCEKEPRENPFCDTESCSAKRSEVLAPQKHSETAVFEISFEVSLDAQHGPANKPHEKHYVQDGKRSAQVESFKTISDSQSVLIRRGMKKIATSLTNADGTASGAVHAFFLTPALYAILATYVLLEFAHTVVDTTLVAYAMDKGHPRRAAEAMIMYRAAAGMTGRLAFTFVSDAFAFKRDHLVAFSIFAESLCFALLPQASSYRSVALLVIGFSATSGTIFALKPVMMAEHLGVDMLTATWGLLGLCLVPVMLGSPFIIGYFRDELASFDHLYRLIAALDFLTALIVLALAFKPKFHMGTKHAELE